MNRYKAYSEYKNSGVEWLDTVPTHWSRVAIKYMALEEGSLFLDGDWIESKDISSEGIKYITTGNIGEGAYKEQGSGFISEDKFSALNCTEVFPGDVLISRLNAPIGRACVVPYLASRVVTSVDNVIFRPDQLYSKEYLVRLFSSPAYFEHTSNLARGATMQRISRGLLGNIRVVLPPKIEQEKIAAFLAYETAKIDALIEKQQRLIELLKEKRQAVISHAVTKGLNPNAPMKDSGVEWLGPIPIHWVSVPLKRICALKTGLTPPTDNESNYSDEESLLHWIRPEDLNEKGEATTGSKYLSETGWQLMRKIPPQSTLICCIGTIGKIGFVENTVTTNQQITAAIFKRSKRFNFYLTNAARNILVESATGNVIKILNSERLGNIIFVSIPPEEAENIAAFLDHETAKIDALIEKQRRLIELAQERRTALISAAVTGKIDVRDWQAAA